MNGYSVALDVYNGPVDLLLFLIRRDEIDIYDIPISRITEQYLQYVEMLRHIDPEIASEFLVLAATLMEIKSRVLLPRPPADETEEDFADPRLELVRQLLEYKKYKDVALTLQEAASEQARKHARGAVPPPEADDATELENLEVWDLFEAFNRLLEQTGRRGAVHEVDVDDTPVALHAEDIVDSIQRAGGEQEFEGIFTGRTRAEMIGLFLALLEMIRQRRIQVSQERPFGPIQIRLLDPTPIDLTGDAEAMGTTPGDGDTAPAPAEAYTEPDPHPDQSGAGHQSRARKEANPTADPDAQPQQVSGQEDDTESLEAEDDPQ